MPRDSGPEAACATVASASPALMTSPQPPNIILVVMDTAAARRCSVYGHPRRTTPGLEAIARGIASLPRVFFLSGMYPTKFHRT